MALLRPVAVLVVVLFLLLGEAHALRTTVRLEGTHPTFAANSWNISLQDAVVAGTTAGRIFLTSVTNVSTGFMTSAQAVDVASGKTAWTWSTENPSGTPLLMRTFSQAPNVVAFVSRNGDSSELVLLHANNGSVIWSAPNATLSDATDLFMATDSSTLYVVADGDFFIFGTVSGFDVANGDALFQQVPLGFNYQPVMCGPKGAHYPCLASLTELASSGGGYETNLTFLHGRSGAVAGLKTVVPTGHETSLVGQNDVVILVTGASVRRINTATFATVWDSQALNFAEGLGNGALLPYIDPGTRAERLAVVIPTWREMWAMDVTTGKVLWFTSAWVACPLGPNNQSGESFGYVGLTEFPAERRGAFAATLHCDYPFKQIQVVAVYETANATSSIWQTVASTPSTGIDFYALGSRRFATIIKHSTTTESVCTFYDARSLRIQQQLSWTSSANTQNPLLLFHSADRDVVQEAPNSTGTSFLATVA